MAQTGARPLSLTEARMISLYRTLPAHDQDLWFRILENWNVQSANNDKPRILQSTRTHGPDCSVVSFPRGVK